jgi:hypothetical protein
MTRQYRRLQRIRLRTTAQRAVPPDFMARLIRAQVFLTVDGQTVEIDHTGRVRKESRQ